MESDPALDPPADPIVQECPHCQGLIDVSGLDPLAKITCPACAGELQVHGMIGPFELLKIAGRGGMGVVYKAMDTQLHRQVALKLLRKDHSDNQSLIAQLETEAAITASINHPHVVKVYSTGSDLGRFYIAMELVDKGSLDDLIRIQGRVAEAQVLQVGAQIAKGLRAAHQHGLIHRDVKPGNILFASAASAKIVDFGLAIFMSEEEAARGEVWGTPYYVAPEKLDNRPEDFRSDIYSLGGTLFHALAGRPPFEAESASLVALKHLKSEPVSLQSFAPNVSGRTNYIINRTLLKDPDQRYQSYDELIEHLEYAQEELLANAGNKGQPTRVVIGESQKAWGWISAVMVGLILFGGIAIFAFRDRIFVDKDADQGPELVEKVKSNLPSLLQLAEAKLVSGEATEAAEEFRKILAGGKLNQRDTLIGMMFEGLAELNAGRLPAAQSAFGKMVQRGPGDLSDKEELEFHKFLIETASKLASDSPPPNGALRDLNAKGPQSIAFLLYGLKSWQQGQIEEAGSLFRQFRSAEPTGAYVWIKDLKPIAVHYVDDLTQFQMGAGRLKVADNNEKKAAIARELRTLKGPLAPRVEQLLAPYLGALQKNEQEKNVLSRPLVVGAWTGVDIGPVGLAGSASVNDQPGSFSLSASGEDIWGTVDAFYFLYQKVEGDFEVVTRVTFIEKVHDWAKAGLMARAALSPGSRNVVILANPNNRSTFAFRQQSDKETKEINRFNSPLPMWVRLVRSGNRFTGSYSKDGKTWEELGSESFDNIPKTLFVGHCLTSHIKGTPCRANFESYGLKQ